MQTQPTKIARETARAIASINASAKYFANSPTLQKGDLQPHDTTLSQNTSETKPDKSDNLTCSLSDQFSQLLDNAITLGAQYHKALREVSIAHYEVAFEYHTAAAHQKLYKNTLEKQCEAKKIEVTPGKTTPYHMIVRLTFNNASKQYVSDKVHVLLVALAHTVKPEDFPDWLENQGGERKIVVTYKRDGSLKQKSNSDNGKDNGAKAVGQQRKRDAQIELARQQLAASVLFAVDKATATQALNAPATDTECAAIILHCADGSVVIKALVQDSEATDAVYTEYYRENAEKIESSQKQKRIEEMLAQSAEIKISEIRKELGEEIAAGVSAKWKIDRQFNEDMTDTPEGLVEYQNFLNQANRLSNVSPEKSESAYQSALDELEQAVAEDPTLTVFLNKPFSDDILPDHDDVPRLKTSKSSANGSGGVATISKQASVRAALEHELEELKNVRVSDADAQAFAASLARSMQQLKKHSATN